MEGKKQYFVAVNQGDIKLFSSPSNSMEFEIYATYDQMKEIEFLMKEKSRKSQQNMKKSIISPFKEREIDKLRNEHGGNLIKLYQKIYEYGTPRTKNKIDQAGILKGM